MPVEYVAIRITPDARDCIKAAALPRETLSETIIRCCSDMQQPHNNTATEWQHQCSNDATITRLEERVRALEEYIFNTQHQCDNIVVPSPTQDERIIVTDDMMKQIRAIIDFGLTAYGGAGVSGTQKALMQDMGIENANVIQKFKSGGRGNKTIVKSEYDLILEYGRKNGLDV